MTPKRPEPRLFASRPRKAVRYRPYSRRRCARHYFGCLATHKRLILLFVDSINHPNGAGNPYRVDSPTNPYGQGLKIYGDED